VFFSNSCLAAIYCESISDNKLAILEAQSLPMIAIGRCPNSNGLQFYNLANEIFVSSINHKFQPHVTSGARFGYHYQPGTFIYRLDESTSIFAPKFALGSSVFVHTHSPLMWQRLLVSLPRIDLIFIQLYSMMDQSWNILIKIIFWKHSIVYRYY
jgi:hypothetical protein